MANYASQSVVYGRAFTSTVLAAFKTVPGGALVATAKIRLSKDPVFNPTPDSDRATLAANEADYTGYTAGGLAVVLSVPLNTSPDVQAAQVVVLFDGVGGPPFTPNQIYGWWIDDGTNYVVGERFAGGLVVSISAAGDFLDLTAFLPAGMLQPAA